MGDQVNCHQAVEAIGATRWDRTLDILKKVAAAVGSSLEIGEIFRETCQEAKEFFDSSHSAVVIFDAGDEHGLVEAEFPIHIGAVGRKLPIGREIKDRLLKSQTPIVIENVAEELPEGELRDILLGFDIQSLLAAPMTSRGRLIGGFSLETIGAGRKFTAEELSLCQTLAAQVAMAAENDRLRRLEETQQAKAALLGRVSDAKKLAGVIARVSTLGDREKTLQLIADGTLDALGCDAVTLYAYDQRRDKLDYPPKTAGLFFPERTKVLPEVRHHSIVYQMLHRDEPSIVQRAAKDEMLKRRRFTRQEKIKSLVAVPLIVAGRRTGVIFFNYRTEHRFTEDELDNIRMFADLAAVAIHNAQLFGEKTAKLREQQTLAWLSQELLGAANVEGVLKRSVEVARSVLDTKYASLVLPDENGDLTTRAASGWEEEIADIFRPGNGLSSHAGYTVIQKAPVRVSDYSTEARFHPPEIVFRKGIKSGISAPINQVNGVTGAILAQTAHPREFNAEEETLLRMIANETSLAIQRAQHSEELETVKSRVVAGAALAWMGMESAHRHHDIHNGLMTILGRIQLIRAKAEQPGDNKAIPDWMEDHLRLIESEIMRINKPCAAPFSSDEGVEDVLITELVCERLNLLWKRPEYCGVVLAERPDPAELFSVRANPEWVGRALDILLDNALQAVARVEPERREISARCRAVGGSVEIAVIDRGRGIPDGVREQLFKVIVDHPAKANGQGRGLLIAQGIIDAYGGTIFVAATGPSGAEMVIRLPMIRRGADELNVNILAAPPSGAAQEKE